MKIYIYKLQKKRLTTYTRNGPILNAANGYGSKQCVDHTHCGPRRRRRRV